MRVVGISVAIALAAGCAAGQATPSSPAPGAAAPNPRPVPPGTPDRVALGDVFAAVAEHLAQFGPDAGVLRPAPRDVHEPRVAVDLPPVPASFDPPPTYPDGTQPVLRVLLAGGPYLDTEITVKGYVVWIYDCVAAIRSGTMTRKQAARIAARQPERCSRPHFILADSPDDHPREGAWVVDVPRKPRADERRHAPERYAELDAAWRALPAFAVGAQVAVTGIWANQSPLGFRNSDGLLVFRSMRVLRRAAPGR